MTRPRLVLLVGILALLPAPAGAQEEFELAVEGFGFQRDGMTFVADKAATGETAGAATGATGASASPSPGGTSSPLGGAGFVVLGLLLGAFLLLRTRLLRRRP